MPRLKRQSLEQRYQKKNVARWSQAKAAEGEMQEGDTILQTESCK